MTDRSHVTAHVLDASRGVPAQGVSVSLCDSGGHVVATGATDGDGRIAALGPATLSSGTYSLTFASGDYFAAAGTPTFYPTVVVTVDITAADQHYHVPLLLSPFAYTTYRGS